MPYVRLLVAAALIAADAIAGARAGAFDVSEIAPGNFVHYGTHAERSPANLGDNANIGFIVGERCVAVIDTGGSLPVGRALREAIRSVTPLPVCYVVITHVHPDHFFGAAAFVDDHPQFVGHARLPAALAARGSFYVKTLERDLGTLAAGSEVIVPDRLVRDELLLDLGARTIRLRAWPIAHTDNDVTVYDEQTGTLWASDLLFIDHTPVIDGSIVGFVDAIAQLRALPARHYVAGHGRSALAWPAVLAAEDRYLQLILRETRQALKDGKTIQEAVDSVGYSAREQWVNFELYHRRNVTSAYTELEWE